MLCNSLNIAIYVCMFVVSNKEGVGVVNFYTPVIIVNFKTLKLKRRHHRCFIPTCSVASEVAVGIQTG